MSLDKKLENGVEQVLKTDTVSKARKILQSRSGIKIISAVSFMESALPVPLLTDPFLVAAILAERKNTAQLIIATTVASVLGGLCAYFSAVLFFDTLSGWMSLETMTQFQELVNSTESSALVLTLIGAVTPVPYTLVAWVVAVIKGSLLAFIAASIIGRGLRYAVVGYCAYRFGPLAISYAKRYIGLTSVLILILALAFLWFKM